MKEVEDKWIECTGDVVAGDTIEFEETVWSGDRDNRNPIGERVIRARVLRDSYGKERLQHTFSIVVIDSTGTEPEPPGKFTTRKGRNIYRIGTKRLPWDNENDRKSALEEKHARGKAAREFRDQRKANALPANSSDDCDDILAPPKFGYEYDEDLTLEFRNKGEK